MKQVFGYHYTINIFFYQKSQLQFLSCFLSLTLVTFFFETSKLWANIYALVGLECQEVRIGLLQAMRTIESLT
jgi:hypothetical protein